MYKAGRCQSHAQTAVRANPIKQDLSLCHAGQLAVNANSSCCVSWHFKMRWALLSVCFLAGSERTEQRYFAEHSVWLVYFL